MQVVAAVIEQNNLILIGQRKANARNHPLKWEFPGGKVEQGETAQVALARELREELSIDAVIGPLLDSYPVRYGDGPLTELLFFQVTEFSGAPQNLDFEQIQWADRQNLATFDFLEGDIPFLRRLMR